MFISMHVTVDDFNLQYKLLRVMKGEQISSICLLTLFAKIKFSRKFPNLQCFFQDMQ